jgi:protoporphyrin/coproporphyrin ferrochelatase
LREWNQLLARPSYRGYSATIRQSTVCSYYQHPLFLEALAETIRFGLEGNEWGCAHDDVLIVFSAHGLPVCFVEKNKDPYPRQIKATAEALISQHFPRNAWQLCWQSRVGPMAWLTPYTEALIEQLAKEGRDNVLVVPIAFVSDHIETLFELDQLYIPQGREGGMQFIARSPSLNDSQRYQACLAGLVLQAIESPNLCKALFPPEQEGGRVCRVSVGASVAESNH